MGFLERAFPLDVVATGEARVSGVALQPEAFFARKLQPTTTDEILKQARDCSSI
jgi:hypothetical protein